QFFLRSAVFNPPRCRRSARVAFDDLGTPSMVNCTCVPARANNEIRDALPQALALALALPSCLIDRRLKLSEKCRPVGIVGSARKPRFDQVQDDTARKVVDGLQVAEVDDVDGINARGDTRQLLANIRVGPPDGFKQPEESIDKGTGARDVLSRFGVG